MHKGDDTNEGPVKSLGSAIEESFAELSPKPLWKWCVKRALNKGWATSLIVIGLAVYVTYYHMDSVCQRRVAEKEGEIKAISKDRDDSRNALLNIKMDSREMIRQKDTELAKLSSELQSAKLRENVLLSIPSNAVNMYSNIAAITNSLSEVGFPRAVLKLSVNGVAVTNVDNTPNAVVPATYMLMPAFSNVQLSVENLSQVSAKNLNVLIETPISPNDIMLEHWEPQPTNDAGWYRWVNVSQHSILQYGGYQADTIKLLPSYHGGVLPMRVFLYADNSSTFEFYFVLLPRPE